MINEVCTSNTSLALGAEQQNYDFIEICNQTSEPIHLNGYYLSDDLSNPTQWAFPDVDIQPGAYLLIYASGEDNEANGELHANFKLSNSSGVVTLSNGRILLLKSMFPS